MDLFSFCKEIDTYLNVSQIKDYCPNGLQVEGKKQIEKVAVAVSASEETILLALEQGVDALIVHHGMFWNRDPYPLTGTKKRKVELLMSLQISLIAYHLPLDMHVEIGNNWFAAKQLGWENLEPFYEVNGGYLGVKGKFSERPVDQFQQELEKYYDHKAHCGHGGKQIISSAALISGGAHKQILDAANEGVDCFITGSFDEPTWHQAKEEKIHFFALGHSATERVGPRALGDHIQSTFGIESCFLDPRNPF